MVELWLKMQYIGKYFRIHASSTRRSRVEFASVSCDKKVWVPGDKWSRNFYYKVLPAIVRTVSTTKGAAFVKAILTYCRVERQEQLKIASRTRTLEKRKDEEDHWAECHSGRSTRRRDKKKSMRLDEIFVTQSWIYVTRWWLDTLMKKNNNRPQAVSGFLIRCKIIR